MKKLISQTLVLAFVLVSAQAVKAAAGCEISTHRTACPDKEVDALKPYSGKNPTTEPGKAKTEEDCLKEGEKAAKIVRKGTLSKKAVTILFDGKEIGKKQDEQACK